VAVKGGGHVYSTMSRTHHSIEGIGFNHDGADIDSPSQFYRDAAVPNQPTHEEIAVRAYELFLKRGLAAGREIEDRLQAEKELVNEKKPQK
jgi:hypothetical protein